MLSYSCWIKKAPMAGVYKLDISESVEELKQLLREQKNTSDKERIHLLYCICSKVRKPKR